MADVQTKTVSWRSIILDADPEFYSEKEIEYEFSNGRKFTCAKKEESTDPPPTIPSTVE